MDLNPIELKYFPYMISVDRCNGSRNTLDDFFVKICAPNTTEDANINVFNMITGLNEAKTLLKLISCSCNCKNLIVKNVIVISVDVSPKYQ